MSYSGSIPQKASYPTSGASRPHKRDPTMFGRKATVHLRCIARTRGCMQVYNTSQGYVAETSKATSPSTLPEQLQPQDWKRIHMLGWHCVAHSTSHTHQPFSASIDDTNHQRAIKPAKAKSRPKASCTRIPAVFKDRIQHPNRTTRIQYHPATRKLTVTLMYKKAHHQSK